MSSAPLGPMNFTLPTLQRLGLCASIGGFGLHSDAASWNPVQSHPGHFTLACVLPITDTMPHVVIPTRPPPPEKVLRGRFSLLGNSSPPHTLSSAREAARSELEGHESASPPACAQARSALSRVRRTLTLLKTAGIHHATTQIALRLDSVHPPLAGAL